MARQTWARTLTRAAARSARDSTWFACPCGRVPLDCPVDM